MVCKQILPGRQDAHCAVAAADTPYDVVVVVEGASAAAACKASGIDPERFQAAHGMGIQRALGAAAAEGRPSVAEAAAVAVGTRNAAAAGSPCAAAVEEAHHNQEQQPWPPAAGQALGHSQAVAEAAAVALGSCSW